MTALELFLGPEYLRTKRMLRATEFLPSSGIDLIQRRNLVSLLEHATKHLQFYAPYRGLCAGLNETNVLDRLVAMPLMDKASVRANLDGLTHGPAYRRLSATTGGSTGEPMRFIRDKLVTRQREKAFIWDQWSRVGYRPGDARASFRGAVPKGGKVYQHFRSENAYVFSSFDLVPDRIGATVRALNEIDPLFLHGYPSALSVLALLIERHQLDLDIQPKAAFCASEKLFATQRATIERVFQCRAFSHYGHSEYAALGGECESSQALHFYPQYGFTEFRDSGLKDGGGRQMYEIVATGFNNRVMPLIRYRTGDYAILRRDSCVCGRNYPIVDEVIGRAQEFIVDSEGNLVNVTALIFGQHYEEFGQIQDLTIEQLVPGKVELVIVPGANGPGIGHEIAGRVEELTDGRLTASVRLVSGLPLNRSGKRLMVDQHLDLRSFMNDV